MKTKIAAALAVALAYGSPASAHHGVAPHYDVSKPVTIEGVVSRFEFVNPHSFLYIDTKDAAGATGWDKMAPVGLMWGADPTLLPSSGQKPAETQVNPKAPAYALNHLGWGGRMNGPVDNPASACMSLMRMPFLIAPSMTRKSTTTPR